MNPPKSFHPFLALLAALLVFPLAALAETVKDREGAVREDKAKMESQTTWIYNDFEQGFAEARRTGKPLLVVLRCVPCLGCMGIDTQVLMQNSELDALLNQFVRVRVINANALDLSKFQFDYDLSFSSLFFNGDGTLYGRYGSWLHQKDAQEKSVTGYKRALEAALQLHQGYPANKSSLTAKQGKPSRFETPVDLPALKGKFREELDWDGKVVKSCVHCHQIGDANRLIYRDQGQTLPTQWIYPFPQAETVGLTLADDAVAHVEEVTPGSAAATAGLRPGDDLLVVQGQPLISAADVSWALHHAPDTGSLTVQYKRNGTEHATTLNLATGWRHQTDIGRRVGTWPMRRMAFGGMKMNDLTDDERAARGLPGTGMALHIVHVGQYGEHAAAKRAGFQKDDILVSLGGNTQRLTESRLIGMILTNKRPGEKISATVLRKGRKVQLQMPVQ